MAKKLGRYVPEPNTGCWLWEGSVDKDGYGTIGRVGGGHLKAHRESYRFHCKDPGDKHVLHHCDTCLCINPQHLYLGDPAKNTEDKMRRGRFVYVYMKGEKNGMRKLSRQQVKEIRKRCEQGEKQKQLADEYNIKQATVSKIVRRERWGHI